MRSLRCSRWRFGDEGQQKKVKFNWPFHIPHEIASENTSHRVVLPCHLHSCSDRCWQWCYWRRVSRLLVPYPSLNWSDRRRICLVIWDSSYSWKFFEHPTCIGFWLSHPKSTCLPPGKKAGFPKGKHNIVDPNIFPQTGLPVGFYLRKKNRLDTLVGALGLVGRGFGPAGRAGLGWAWGLAVLGFGRAGRAGWVGRVGRAGPLAGLGVVGRAVGVGFGRAGAGCWACWACWAR